MKLFYPLTKLHISTQAQSTLSGEGGKNVPPSIIFQKAYYRERRIDEHP